MSIHNMCFHGEIKKKLLPDNPLMTECVFLLSLRHASACIIYGKPFYYLFYKSDI